MELVPIVSVCMITYGHEDYIREAIEGVLMQECDFEIELIVANDCSPDKSDTVIQHILENHSKGSVIKYIKHASNIGMMPNFIFAIQQCQGKYIALCEGDDYWTDPLKLQKQFNILEKNSEFKFCVTNLDSYCQSTSRFTKNILNTFKKPLHLNIEDFLVKKAFMAPCTWLGLRECFFLTDTNDIQCDGSFAIFMDVLQHTKVYFLSDTTAVYRILQESASHSNSFLKTLNYNQGIYRIQLHYIEKYNLYSIKDIVDESYRDSIKLMLRKNYQNFELSKAVKVIQDDFKSDDIIILIQDLINYYQKELIKINNSKSLRIGKLVIAPLVYIKNKFNV
jgi:glucosyltransferase